MCVTPTTPTNPADEEKAKKVIAPIPVRAAILVGKLMNPAEVKEFVDLVFKEAPFTANAVAAEFAKRLPKSVS